MSYLNIRDAILSTKLALVEPGVKNSSCIELTKKMEHVVSNRLTNNKLLSEIEPISSMKLYYTGCDQFQDFMNKINQSDLIEVKVKGSIVHKLNVNVGKADYYKKGSERLDNVIKYDLE